MLNQFYSNLFKVGNLKLGFDTLIFNEGTAFDCPSKKLGLCDFENRTKAQRKGKRVCYACKMEWSKHVVNYRKRQEKFWNESTPEQFANAVKDMVKHFREKGLTIKYLRINESHDLKSIEDLQKWFAVAKLLKGLKVYTYTHRSDIVSQLEASELPKNFILQTSNFKADKFNSFITYKLESELPKKALKCKGNCATCKLCKVNHGKSIYVKEH